MKLDIHSAPFPLRTIHFVPHMFMFYGIFSHKLINQVKVEGVTVTGTKRPTFSSNENMILTCLKENRHRRGPGPCCSTAVTLPVSSPGGF